MKLTTNEWLRDGGWMGVCRMAMVPILLAVSIIVAIGTSAYAQSVSTTTVQGTVSLANGQPGSGTLNVSWPAFTTAGGQAVAADQMTVTIGSDGYLSVNLAPNLGATPAGLYYTVVYYLSDGTTSTEYWVVPAAAQATLGSVRSQLMPAAQAVQAVNKAYVDEAISELAGSQLTAAGGTLTGPLYLSGDPTQALQAADKHYVDDSAALAVPLTGGAMTGALTAPSVNAGNAQFTGTLQVGGISIQFPGLAASSGYNCLQIDNSGKVTNTGSACGSGSGSSSGTVNSGTAGQIAYYSANGTAVTGVTSIPITAGGTGATTAASALTSLGGAPLASPIFTGTVTASAFSGALTGHASLDLPLAGGALTGAATNSSTYIGAGIQDTLDPYIDTFTATGADESVKYRQPYATDITNNVSGRIYRSTGQGAATAWSVNPFNLLSASSGALPAHGTFTVKLQPSQTVTAAQEIDLGLGGVLDCQNGFAGYSPGAAGGAFIQPATSGYPTVYLFTDGPLSSSTNTSFSQGSKILNCGLYANGLSGMTGILRGWGEEGTLLQNNRLTGFQVGIQFDAPTGSTGPMHGWGVRDSEIQIENDATDTWQAGILKGKVNADSGGFFQNLSLAGGADTTGIIKTGFDNSGNNTDVDQLFIESLMFGIHNDSYHGSGHQGNDYKHVSCVSANAPVSFCGYNDNTGPDLDSVWEHITSNGTYNLVDAEPGGAEIRPTVNEPELAMYRRGPFNSILSLTPQAVSTNIPQGAFFYNSAAWPSLFLPAKLTTGSQSSGPTVRETQYMTATDVTNGVMPYGISGNGQLSSGASGSKGVGVANKGKISCIFDGATTAGDYVALSSAAVIGSAVGCHDTGSSILPTSGIYLGTVDTTTASAPSAPSVPTCTLTGATGSTTYTFGVVQRGNANIDQTQSAISSTCSVTTGPAWLTTTDYITLSGAFTNCTSTAPCDVYETAGPTITVDGVTWATTGYIGQVKSNTTFIDYGIAGDSHSGVNIGPYSAGIVAPLVDVQIGLGQGASLTNPMTALGDTIYGGAGGSPARLGIGTAAQVLTVNSGATAPIWQTPSYVPAVSYTGGDLVCAHAADTTIAANTITAGTSSTLTGTTVSSSYPAMTIPGAKIGVTGATPSGLNGGPYTVTSASGNILTFSSLPATWTSGGTIYLWCSNQSNDALTTNSTTYQPFSANTYSISSLAAGASYTQHYQLAYWSTVTAPALATWLEYGSTWLFEDAGATPVKTSATGSSAEITWDLLAPTSTLMVTTKQATTSYGAANVNPTFPQPIVVGASGALKMSAGYAATGLQSITSYTSGATVTGTSTQTCLLTAFNNSDTNATATATLTATNTLAGATFVVTNTGYGATAAPTTATVGSGTATCSGTGTFVTVLGGAQSNAILLETLKTTQ